LAATCAFALSTGAFADIEHWVAEPYQPGVAPGSDEWHPDFNDGSYWTVDLCVTISGDDDWTSTEVDATIDSGVFFQHNLGDATPPLASDVNMYPALEFDSFYLSTEADAANQPPFKDPSFAGLDAQDQHLWAVWFDTPYNGGDGDFVIARFTVKLTSDSGTLTLAGASTTYEYGGELFPFEFEVHLPGCGDGSNWEPGDCNNNGIEDYLDYLSCDGSPWCSDCNENWNLDECDIADGTSQDSNDDGVPDECDFIVAGSVYRLLEVWGTVAWPWKGYYDEFEHTCSISRGGPWDGSLSDAVQIPEASASAQASQTSLVALGRIAAAGALSLHVYAWGDHADPAFAEASATSTLETSFDLLHAARIELSGELTRGAVNLWRDGNHLFGASGTRPFEFEEVLEPGYCTFEIYATDELWCAGDWTSCSDSSAAAYEATLLLTRYCAGDVTGDADTDHSDLGVLLALWGMCEEDPDYDPAVDLNNDGCINHPDLGILLSDWGCGG
jgi:hypothetical protein